MSFWFCQVLQLLQGKTCPEYCSLYVFYQHKKEKKRNCTGQEFVSKVILQYNNANIYLHSILFIYIAYNISFVDTMLQYFLHFSCFLNNTTCVSFYLFRQYTNSFTDHTMTYGALVQSLTKSILSSWIRYIWPFYPNHHNVIGLKNPC